MFEVRLVDTQLNTNEVDVLKDAEIAGSVVTYWVWEKMRTFKERTKRTILAFFYNTSDEELYALTATEYFVNLENITGILWDP